ncbi:acetyl transferase [Mycobacteroides abscessus subsp. massiliense]|nr:acetyl transferase [Mycobacteroides abscessus subsp. massiliense]
MREQYTCVPLIEDHHTAYFGCHHDDGLDQWLDHQALADKNLGRSATHVWLDKGGCVVAYFTLLQTTIRESDGSLFSFLRPKGYPRNHALPGVLIGKLALDRSLQGRGLGMDLIADAYFTACEAVMLIDEQVADIYREFGFQAAEGSDRMFLNFREFNKGTALS